MKHFLLAATILLAVGLVRSPMAANGEQLAVAGCCKELKGNRWVSNGEDFEDCLKINAQEDKDDVYEKQGIYWWDIRC